MTLTEQTEVLMRFGYSRKEAGFVAQAALHSGFFLARQYHDRRGGLVKRLCAKTVNLGHASVTVYGLKTRLYHLHHRALYAALGSENCRHRKEAEGFRTKAKLMGFDYALLNPGYRYLPTEEDKLDYFLGEMKIPEDVLPQKKHPGKGGTSELTTRFFTEQFPIRVRESDNHVAFCYINPGVYTDISFKTWLERYLPLVNALDSAEVVYVADSDDQFKSATREFSRRFEAANQGISRDLLNYFSQKLEIEKRGNAALASWGRTQLDAYRELAKRYSDLRFQAQYDAWRAAPEPEPGVSKVKFSTFVIPYSYAWLGTIGRSN